MPEKRWIIAKRGKSKWSYWSIPQKRFDSRTFTLFTTLAEASMVLVHLAREGALDKYETSDLQIKEVSL